MDKHEFSKLFKESLFKKLYEEIEKNLSKGPNSEFFLFLLKEGQNMAKELKRFKLDYEKYKTGIFLWWNEDYPKLKKFLEIISTNEVDYQFSCYENMKLTVKEFYNLISDTKNLNLQLFNEEFIESKKLVFKKNINPINILQKKNSLIKLINDELKAFTSKITPRLEDYTNQITPQFKTYLDFIKELLEVQSSSISTNLIKGVSGEIAEQDFQDNLKEIKENFNESINKQNEYFHSLLNNIKKNTKVRKQDILLYSKELETSYKLIEKGILQDDIIDVRNSIMLIKDIDSYNIHFCRFVNRLYHILTKNNRNYIDKSNCYFNIKPKPYNPKTRPKLEKFISNQLKIKYPKLATFLLKGFNYNEIRKLDAHEIPEKIQLSDDEKFAFIPQTGDVPDIEMDLEDVDKFINSYCFFIDALGLY